MEEQKEHKQMIIDQSRRREREKIMIIVNNLHLKSCLLHSKMPLIKFSLFILLGPPTFEVAFSK